MVELLPSVDAWCSYLGWTLLALGLVSCLFPRTFKLGVIVMILGNIPLILGIAAPRRVMEWVINRGVAPSQFPSVEQSHSLGIASGVVIFILLFLLYWYPLRGRKGSRYYFWQRGKPRLSDDDPIMSADGQLATDQAVSKNSKRTKKPRVSTMHLKSGDNPLSLKDTSKAHDELTQIDAEREPTLSSDLFTKRGSRRAGARAQAQAHKGKGPGRAVPGTAAPAAGATSAAASGAAGAAPQERAAPSGSNLGLGSGYPRAHTAVSGAEVPPPSLGSFLSRLDAMTAGAEHPASVIPDAVIPGGSAPLVNEPHVSAGVTAPEPQLSGHKVGELLQDLNSNATAPERVAGRESVLSGSRGNGGSGNDGGSGSGGSFSFAEILSSASSRQSKLEAEQQAAAHGATAPGDASDLSAALSAHGPTVRPSARTSAPVEEALQELGALSDDEIDLSREAKLGQAPSGPDKTKLYSPGRTVGQALAELDQAIPTEAEVISSEQPHALETPTAPDSDDLITALSTAEVEVVNAAELAATASKEAAAAQAQDLAPERVQSIKSLEAELEAKEAALKAREAALEAQQAALKAKEAMLALGSKEAETAAAAPAPAPAPAASSAAPRAAEPSSAPSAAPSQEHSDDLPSASYSFVLSSQRKESARAPSKLPHFAGDSTSYSFELDFKSAPYHKEQRAEPSAPTKQVKVEATFSEQRLSAEPKAPAAPEVSAAARAAQAQAEQRAASEQRVQQTKEAKRQRDEAMWQRAEHVAHELLNEVQSLDESAPVPAPMSAEQLSAQPAPIKAPRRTKSNLPYALTADYTDAGQDEARSLAALLKGDADLVHTMEQVKAQTDAALIAADVASPDGLKSLGGNVPQNAQRYSLLEDSAEVERMFETITRVLQENAETQAGATSVANAGAPPATSAAANPADNAELSAEPSLTTTPASAAARLHVAAPEAAPQPVHPQPPHTTQDQSGPMGALELNEPDNGALHLEPAAAASQPPQSAPAAARKSAVARSARKIAAARPTGAPKAAPAAVPAAAPQPAPEHKRAAPATTESKVDASSTKAAAAERKSARRAAPTVAPARPASAAERRAAPTAPQRKAPVRAAAAAAQPVAKSAPKVAAPKVVAPKVAAPKLAAASPATAKVRPAAQEERAVAPQAAAPKAKPSVRKAAAQAAADGAELKLHTPTLEITPAAPAAQVPAPAQAAPAKPSHSLKAKRRSAAAESVAAVPASAAVPAPEAVTAPAAGVSAAASASAESSASAAPKRASLKSHSLKRSLKSAPKRAKSGGA